MTRARRSEVRDLDRFDIPVAKDLTNAQIAQPFLKGGVQFVEQRSSSGSGRENRPASRLRAWRRANHKGLEKPHTVVAGPRSPISRADLVHRVEQ